MLAVWCAVFGALIGDMRRIAREETPVAPYARILFALWVAMAIVGIASTDALNLTAVLFPLLALTGAVSGAASAATSEGQGYGAAPRSHLPSPEVARYPSAPA